MFFSQVSAMNYMSLQIYTRSVIDPIPAPVGDSNVDGGAKSSDKQKKKAKMTDEEIMEKLSMHSILYFLKTFGRGKHLLSVCKTLGPCQPHPKDIA